nr:MAG TPA: nucleoside triphosphate pyrophosphohydrolase [Caudoviricetes sp.]
MAELINELCKEQIGRSSREKVAEEMADVIIMLWQLEMIFKNGDEILQAIDYKLKRLQKRISKGEQKWK